jgi:hypothetical protein
MDAELTELNERIARRGVIRDRKAMCQRYLRISASVEKIEKLLSGASDDAPQSTSAARETAEEALSRGSGELIERVASEFNQLQFYATQVGILSWQRCTRALQKSCIRGHWPLQYAALRFFFRVQFLLCVVCFGCTGSV